MSLCRQSAERKQKCLPAERAASGEKVKNARADNRVAETGKDCGFDAIHCRANSAFWNCQANSAGAAGDHSHGDETGVAVGGGCASSGIGVVSREGVCAAPEGEGAAGATASARFFFFLGRSVFPPPNKLLIILLRSRPTSLSIRFVPGRSIVPPTLKSRA